MIVVASGFSSFLEMFVDCHAGTGCLNLSMHNGYVRLIVRANLFGILFTS